MNSRVPLSMPILFLLLTSAVAGCAQSSSRQSNAANPFWNKGKEFFDIQDITPEGTYHCILVAKDGSVLAFFDEITSMSYVRRSVDGGKTWGPKIETVPGVTKSKVLDENSGDIILFATTEWYRSTDNGMTWKADGNIVQTPGYE